MAFSGLDSNLAFNLTLMHVVKLCQAFVKLSKPIESSILLIARSNTMSPIINKAP